MIVELFRRMYFVRVKVFVVVDGTNEGDSDEHVKALLVLSSINL
jgi:hypothetical protein